MSTIAVIPVKRFAGAKKRLGEAIDDSGRAIVCEAMLSDVLVATARAGLVERVIVVSGEPEARRLAEAASFEVVDDPADAGHPAAARSGVERAIAAGATRVALLPGDCPLLDPAELDAGLGELKDGSVMVVPDRHGTGTNGLFLAPPDAISPAFGEDSCARHVDLARTAGVRAMVRHLPSLALDLDTPDDLSALREALGRRPGAAPFTANALDRCLSAA